MKLDVAENVEKFVGYEERRPEGAERCRIHSVGIHEREVRVFADDAMIPDSAIVVGNNSGKRGEDKVPDVVRQGIPRGHHLLCMLTCGTMTLPVNSRRLP